MLTKNISQSQLATSSG